METKDTKSANAIKELQSRLKTLDSWKERDLTPEQREALHELLEEVKLKVLAFQFANGIF